VQIENANRKINLQGIAVDKFSSQVIHWQQQYNRLALEQLPREQKKLQGLVNELQRLEAILSGASKYCDNELGIICPAAIIPPTPA
jgi:hypothetical protein